MLGRLLKMLFFPPANLLLIQLRELQSNCQYLHMVKGVAKAS